MTSLRLFLETIRFEHTVFALPFAYLGMVLAAGGWPSLHHFVWITVAMGAARTVAFAVNRWADRVYDARNPRTAHRPIPSGRLSPRTTLAYGFIAAVVLTVAAWQLNPLALKLLPGALLFLVGYSFTKRFTWLSHWVLGFTDGLAPMGAWVAVRASLFTPTDLPAWLLLAAVTFWIAGFDLIYACQDTEFDRAEGLYAVPARFGNAVALRLARANHLLTVGFLAAVGRAVGLGWPYWLGLVIVAGLLIYEHSLVSPTDLSRVNIAFFNVNGYIAITLFVATMLALYAR
ncbi:MAG: 4-hydroxybenzoate octaprenyltransferase [Chloroflexi bacterium]|nr:MAG: 4-hydroxybenzoate octaprenyltransferase [Chloroflexota bacterium]